MKFSRAGRSYSKPGRRRWFRWQTAKTVIRRSRLCPTAASSSGWCLMGQSSSVTPRSVNSDANLPSGTHIPGASCHSAPARPAHGNQPRGHGTALEGPTRGGRDPTRPGPQAGNLLKTDLELATSLSFRSPRRIVAAGTCRVHTDERKS